MSDSSASPRKGLLVLLIIMLYVLMLFLLTQQVRSSALQSVELRGKQQLDLYLTYVSGQLDKFEFLPELLSTNTRVRDFLRHPDEAVRIQRVNEYLEQINHIAGSADTYLMDVQGKTVASSNWRLQTSFVGQTFDYRPYFKAAMRGEQGRYFALGTTSGKRGFYFSYPVRDGDAVVGVAVMKIDIDHMESAWNQGDDELVIADPDGIVFITSVDAWRYQTIAPLSELQRDNIRRENRYQSDAFKSWPLRQGSRQEVLLGQRQVISLPNHVGITSEFLLQSELMSDAGWRVYVLSSLAHVRGQVLLAIVVMTFAFIALGMLAMFLQQRRRRLQDRARYEEAAQQALQLAHDQLETRVDERTQDLSHEIEVRKETEIELRQTQNELIQTAKLAVLGQMSTSISHELNQPLAAIRSYADNARMLLDKQREADARNNLFRISELVDRMAQIGTQLKQFSRKTSGQRVKVSPGEALEASLRILNPKLSPLNVTVENNVTGKGFRVLADVVQLEQILVNLISNAANACKDHAQPLVRVHAQPFARHLRIVVSDNGHGLQDTSAEEIFEPFFTTRETGLGLGLSISRRIARSMDGELSASNGAVEGAEFYLDLVRVTEV